MSDTPSWLPGPRNALSVGAVYADATPDSYYYLARLPAEYDVVIFLDQTTASVLLPFNYRDPFEQGRRPSPCHFVLKTTLMRRPSRRTVTVTCGVACSSPNSRVTVGIPSRT